MLGRDKKCVQKFNFGPWNVRSLYLQEAGWVFMDWIDLAQDRDRRRAVMNAVMNLRVP
jgi:hypothetical protein